MTHRFDLATLKAVDVAECNPGFYLHLGSSTGPAKLILKIDSENPKHFFWVQLEGDSSFRTTFSAMPYANKFMLIPLDMSLAKIELPNNPELTSNPETLGAILVCKDETYIITDRITDRGGVDIEYVSLRSFKCDDQIPSNRYGVFPTWRLTTFEANPSDRTILISNGEWPQ